MNIISTSKGLLYFIGIVLTFIGLSYIILVILVNILIGEVVISYLLLIPLYYDFLYWFFRLMDSNMFLCFTVPTILGLALIYGGKKLGGREESYPSFLSSGNSSEGGLVLNPMNDMNEMMELMEKYQKTKASKTTPRRVSSRSTSRGSSYSKSTRGNSDPQSHFDAMKAFNEYHQGTMESDPQKQWESFQDYAEAMKDMSPEDQDMYYTMFMWYSICVIIMFIIAAIVFALA